MKKNIQYMNCQDTFFTIVSHFGWGRIFKDPEFEIMSKKLFLRYHKIFDEYSKNMDKKIFYLQKMTNVKFPPTESP